MRSLFKLVLLSLVTIAALPIAAKQPRATDTLEASASMLSMPSVADGILVVKVCQDCEAITLRASATTQYVLGKEQVTLREFSIFARDNGKAFVAVTHDIAGTRVLRLTASLPTPAP
jgi:hypothetical protein